MGRHDAMPFTREEFDQIYSRVPRLNVEVVVETPSGIVMTKRNIEPNKGQWHLPGGTLRFGESLREAASRVARQELGVEVEVGDILGYIEYPRLNAEGYRGWPIGVAFLAQITAGDLRAVEQADEVACFRALPGNVFADQVTFLTDHGLVTKAPRPVVEPAVG
jgi:ADP-ribose pyrophosphatase YjhB (NUDIX family)